MKIKNGKGRKGKHLTEKKHALKANTYNIPKANTHSIPDANTHYIPETKTHSISEANTTFITQAIHTLQTFGLSFQGVKSGGHIS